MNALGWAEDKEACKCSGRRLTSLPTKMLSLLKRIANESHKVAR